MRLPLVSHRAVGLAAFALVLASLLGVGCDSESGCSNDFDCPAAQVCRVTTGQCEALSCKEDADCESGQVCRDNRCEQP